MGKKTNGFAVYDQASALPFRLRDGEIELCLITSSGRRRWGFPKGVIDPGETPWETALKEAEEEAGVSGEISGPPLGEYTYSKWGRDLRVLVLMMRVDESAEEWQESRRRERAWVGVDDALRLLDRRHLREFVQDAVKRLEVAVTEN